MLGSFGWWVEGSSSAKGEQESQWVERRALSLQGGRRAGRPLQVACLAFPLVSASLDVGCPGKGEFYRSNDIPPKRPIHVLTPVP